MKLKDIHIAIIEDDVEYRNDFNSYCEKSSRLNCILAVDSAEKFIKYAQPTMKLDIVIIDIGLPGISGIETIKFVRRISPSTEIIMLTIFNNYEKTFNALRKGAMGYLLKDLSFSEIEKLLISMKDDGDIPLSPQIARRILAYFQPKKKSFFLTGKKIHLTPKETLIVKSIVDGKTYQQTANEFGISLSGVRFHIKNIYGKLQINSKAELIRIYIDKLNNL